MDTQTLQTKDFDFELPEELIAQTPIEPRDASRLMVLDKTTGEIEHRHFHDITEYLNEGDCLVLNNSRVLPARIYGIKNETGAHVEFLLLKNCGDDVWEALAGPGKRAKVGTSFTFEGSSMTCEVIEVKDDGNRLIRFHYDKGTNFFTELDKIGQMPLPPYIKEKLKDKERYQTVYSKEEGSAAAPTAGLHFTPELLDAIRSKGVKVVFVTLHVGLGTFRPVKEDEIEDHPMHSEFCIIPEETARMVNETKANGGRVVCIGTTSCRTVESFADADGTLRAQSGWTDIFIYPGYKFKCMDALVTNFHLPESTLIMLVSALAGREHILNAYKIAVENRYRFFSFGDAMFIADGLDAGGAE